MHVVQIDKCFGFDTAVEEAQTALLAAKVEASSADQGIGLVKLMGRSSGFIAMQASMASGAHPPLSFTLLEHHLLSLLPGMVPASPVCLASACSPRTCTCRVFPQNLVARLSFYA